MPTPLETLIQGLIDSGQLCLDVNRLAVGTDKVGYSPLEEGVRWIANVTADDADDTVMVPQCYSFELVTLNGKWTEEGNMQWIADAVRGQGGRDAPHYCHVFHREAAKTLKPFDGRTCSLGQFRASYGGQRNATFKEVEHILNAGYTKVSDFHRADHVVLSK